MRPAWRVIWPFSLVLALDQLSKLLICKLSSSHYPSLTWLSCHLNTQAAFSLPLPNLMVAIGSLFVLGALFLIFSTRSLQHNISAVPLALLASGGSANIIDRLFRGGVIDIFQWGSGTFNLADLAIAAGAGLLIWSLTFTNHRRISCG